MAGRIIEWLSRARAGGETGACRAHEPSLAATESGGSEPKRPNGGLNATCPGFEAMILEQVNDAVIALDLDLRILTWNKAAEMIYGWHAVEVIGKLATEIIPVIRY